MSIIHRFALCLALCALFCLLAMARPASAQTAYAVDNTGVLLTDGFDQLATWQIASN